ncbi:MAG: Glutaredoxin 2 (Modular protein) [Candidatus Azambacteria bacterium GW2011_GWB1_46_27]|uniref:Glutaredoxin 2 (Modular protein) n=10 Tax=Candidatus Azamiibacteriota TaxID=1752741 RepID=A0A0G1RXU9_9BACT|nr:MAG: Glutaredoxin 2 (Modular protein) [Candidatus Azambacteria bacterium GW2011_GWB1_46_27]
MTERTNYTKYSTLSNKKAFGILSDMIKIIELSTPGCVHCAEAKKILEEKIRPNFPDVEIEYIDMLTEKGMEMVQKYGIMSSPGIIINGELFASGGLSEQKLVEKIKSLTP